MIDSDTNKPKPSYQGMCFLTYPIREKYTTLIKMCRYFLELIFMNGEKIIIRDPRGVEFSLLCPDFERIPRYLKRHAVWMLTKGEWDGDSFKKEPYTIGYHKRASWQRWSNHHSFEAVKAEYECGGYIGVVFVLTKKARVVCIDIDHAFEADDITYLPKVQEIVDMFPNTYIERSLRGKGIHIFALGTAPSG